MAERWAFNASTGSPTFLYTHVILEEGDDYYSAQLPERVEGPDNLPTIDQFRMQRIPREHIYPPLDKNFTICSDPQRKNVYIKRPRLTGYNGSPSLGLYMLQEARIGEILIKSPHENVAPYLGCVVTAGSITGLCFPKYTETLASRLQENRLINNKGCIRQVKAGIDHLHDLGLVHNDIHIDNVMFSSRDSETPVLIDFGSCAFKGHPLPDKRGEVPKGIYTAEFENDDLGLKLLQEELELKVHEEDSDSA